MWIILLSLALGITIGLIINSKKLISKNSMKYNSKFQQIGIIILLFSMGASIGADRELLGNLKNMGVKALVFGVLTSFFAIFITYMVTFKFIGEEK